MSHIRQINVVKTVLTRAKFHVQLHTPAEFLTIAKTKCIPVDRSPYRTKHQKAHASSYYYVVMTVTVTMTMTVTVTVTYLEVEKVLLIAFKGIRLVTVSQHALATATPASNHLDRDADVGAGAVRVARVHAHNVFFAECADSVGPAGRVRGRARFS